MTTPPTPAAKPSRHPATPTELRSQEPPFTTVHSIVGSILLNALAASRDTAPSHVPVTWPTSPPAG